MPSRSVVITGGFGVLGQAVAAHFVGNGNLIALVDAAQEIPEAVQLRFAGHCLLPGTDLSDEVATTDAFNRIEKHMGRVDCLINIAGGFCWETLSEGSLDSWDRMYVMNVRTAVTTSKCALPLLSSSRQGRIVNVGASASARAGLGMGAYTAAKSGVARLTESLAEELKDTGITVNAVLPSILDTPANRADMPDADFSRWVRPEALASVIGFLCSDASAAVTGASIPVTHRC